MRDSRFLDLGSRTYSVSHSGVCSGSRATVPRSGPRILPLPPGAGAAPPPPEWQLAQPFELKARLPAACGPVSATADGGPPGDDGPDVGAGVSDFLQPPAKRITPRTRTPKASPRASNMCATPRTTSHESPPTAGGETQANSSVLSAGWRL